MGLDPSPEYELVTRQIVAKARAARLANPTDDADEFAYLLARRRAQIRWLAGRGQWAPTPDPLGHKAYRPWGGASMVAPEPGERRRCLYASAGPHRGYQECGRMVIWVLLDGWRIGGWWHDDGSPSHRLFTHGRHPSTVAERPDALPDPDGWLAAVVASTV